MRVVHRALVLVMLLAACSPRDGRFNPSHFALAGAGAPPDIALPAATEPGTYFGGIVTSKPSDESFCCTAGPKVDVPVHKDGPATRLVVGTFVSTAFAGERLRVVFPDGSHRETSPLESGFATASVPLPAGLRSARGNVRIRLEASRAPYVLASIYFD